eukprot:2861687-Alexandrium_andersonii.AAC.1
MSPKSSMVMRGVPRGRSAVLGIPADAPVGAIAHAPARAMIGMRAEARERAMGGECSSSQASA